MRDHMHIGIVAWSLFETRGGVERVACSLAAAMLERGHSVSIVYKQPSRPNASPVYTPPEGAVLVGLDLDYDTLDLQRARRLLLERRLDVLVAMFSWESLLWFPLLLKETDIRLVISEHSNPERINAKWDAYERHACLFAADHIHILSDSFLHEYPASLHSRISVIPNPAYLAQPVAEKKRSGRHTLLGAGRFEEKVKQFSLLIRTFYLLHKEFPKWDLELCGDGPSFGEYLRLVKKLGMEGRVRFPGMVTDIARHYAEVDLFCIPSHVEGFPMVVLEAQHYRLPVVGFASCSGVNDIVVHGQNGLLAEEMSPESLAGQLAILMRDADRRKRLGDRGKQMLDRFAPEHVFNAWEALLHATLHNPAPSNIQRILNEKGDTDAERLAAQELLRREHPFDRSDYLRRHREAVCKGEKSPFSEKTIKRFRKKQQKFGFPGYTTLWGRVKSLLRKSVKKRRLSR